MSNILELLNPEKNWKIGSLDQLNKINISGDFLVKNGDISFINTNINISGDVRLLNESTISGGTINYINILDGCANFNKLSIQNQELIISNGNIQSTPRIINIQNTFSDTSFLTTDSNFHDLSNLFFNEIITNDNDKINVNIKFNYFCCVEYQQRITIELYYYNTYNNSPIKLSSDVNIGPTNATGGLTGTYINNNIYTITSGESSTSKFYIKFKIERAGYYNQGILLDNSNAYIILEKI